MGKMSKEEVDDLKLQGMSIGLSNADISDLFNHIDAIESELAQANENTRKALANSQTWQDTLLATQTELMLLKQQIPQKIVLPKDVGNEIDYFKFNYEPEIWKWHFFDSYINRGSKTKNSRTIDINVIIEALVNSYTVEQEPTTEDKLRTAWTPVVKKVLYDYNGSYNGEIARELIDKIMPLTREILKAEELEQHEQG